MDSATRSGLAVTFAPFWLVFVGSADGGPERFPHLRVSRPKSGNGRPLSENEALKWWLHSRANGCTATAEAEEYLEALRG